MRATNSAAEHRLASSRSPASGARCPVQAVPIVVALLAAGVLALQAQPSAFGADESDAVAISAKASGEYLRTRLPDGTIQPETFAFAKGGVWQGTQGGSADMTDFMKVAMTIAGPLAGQGYFSSKDPKMTKLLIMVYWGTTHAPEHTTGSVSGQYLEAANAAALGANQPQMVRFNKSDSCAPSQMATTSSVGYAVRTPAQIDMDNALTSAMALAAAEDNQRTQLDAQNAGMLGYDSWLAATGQIRGTPLEYRQRDMTSELEARRYFVVLMAYDFQMLWKQRKAKLLWETRYSICEKGSDFSSRLAAMSASAAAYFGRNSGTLVHKPLPEGHVEVGPVKTLAFSQ